MMDIDIYKINKIAKEAGRIILKYYSAEYAIDTKDDHSPVTAADRAAHEVIKRGLLKLYPAIPVLSEEGEHPPFDVRQTWDHFWLVDPLDGTKEFIHKRGDFTVNIALIQGNKPILGVIYIPVKEMLYYASKNKGAWKQKDGEESNRIHVKDHEDSAGLTVVASRLHISKEDELFLSKFKVKEKVSFGSSLKFCAVAEGIADLYPRLSPTWEWDTAAGQCIVEEAGGGVIDIHGSPIRYNKPSLKNENFVAYAHKEILKGMV